MFMPETEYDQFQKMLNIALEDLVNTKPDNPYKYLAVALCRALPSEELDEQEFPEIADALKQHTYPEGFSPYRRPSVFGGTFSAEELNWSPPENNSEETAQQVKDLMRPNVLFSHLSEESLLKLARATECIEAKAGEVVVKENEPGSSCFFVEKGNLECKVLERGHVCNYQSGSSFGEVSLMYGNLRGATITAVEDCCLWKLERTVYKKVVLQDKIPQEKDFREFLDNDLVFNNLPDSEKEAIKA
mmetsp:Transcript_16252/g.23521  ORF Transcript_16252/g.23521 Transcript_16252/m.23521 type:complete len:245 (+) Transcript_16252:44-778(+)